MSDQSGSMNNPDPGARLQEARNMWARGEADRAIDVLRELNTRAPHLAGQDLAGALLLRGTQREGVRSFYGALQDYEEGLRAAPPGPMRDQLASAHATLAAHVHASTAESTHMIPPEEPAPAHAPTMHVNAAPQKQGRSPLLWVGLLVALLAVGVVAFVAFILPGLSNSPLEAVITPREATRRAQAAVTPTAASTTVALSTTAPGRTATRPPVFRTPTSAVTSNTGELPPGYEMFESQIYPYTIGYPEDWQVQGEFEFEEITVDTFIGDNGVNVNVLAEEELKGLSTETLMRSLIRENENEGATDVERLGEVEIDGKRALLVRWTDADGAGYIQAVWITGTHGWVATMYVDDGDTESNLEMFKEMLSTIKHKLR